MVNNSMSKSAFIYNSCIKRNVMVLADFVLLMDCVYGVDVQNNLFTYFMQDTDQSNNRIPDVPRI